MRIRSDAARLGALNDLAESRVAAKVGAQGQRVREEADQTFCWGCSRLPLGVPTTISSCLENRRSKVW